MSEKKSLKDLIGPIEVTPSVTKQSSIDGTTKIDNEGVWITCWYKIRKFKY
jgi:hypothetical protein